MSGTSFGEYDQSNATVTRRMLSPQNNPAFSTFRPPAFIGLWVALFLATPISARSGKLADTNGIKLGKGRLHLSLDAISGFESNPARINTNTSSDVYLSVRPAADFKSRTDDTQLGAKLSASFRNYLGIQVKQAARITGELGLDGSFNRTGKVTLKIGNTVGRYSDPLPGGGASRDHFANRANVRVGLKPGGGALVFNLGYDFLFDTYDNEPNLDQLAHEPSAEVRWSFFPKTSLYFLASYRLSSFRNGNISFVPLTLGLLGNLTSKFSVELAGGWSQPVDRVETGLPVTGALRLQYSPSASMRLKVGFERVFLPVAGFGHSENNRLRLEYSHIIGSRISLTLGGGFNLQTFGASNISGLSINAGARKDQFATADASLDFRLTPWLTITLYEALEIRSSTGGTGFQDPSYLHNDIYLRFAFHY